MNKIFNGNYTRLDDDTSFQLVRTNPILTTNTKLMYDGDNLYLESYDANPLLNTQRYKNFRVKRTSPFNMDIRNFLADTGDSAYDVFQKESDLSICDSYDKQFETMYWCGAESINSKQYPQELGFIAPLYIRKKLPNYFVIFKVDGPSNNNLTMEALDNGSSAFKDNEFNLWEDVFKKAKIIKSFDLREGTPIGNYIKKYVEQSSFEYDRSIYVNFSTNEIVYYGIDKIYGVLTSKKENFKKELLENDNTIMHSDDWITSGYKRNGLIYPYIFNMEFLFDDDDTENYEFSRYFGMYCNDIDLYEFEARYEGIDKPEEIVSPFYVNNPIIFTDGEDELLDFKNSVEGDERSKSFYYIKDKNNDLHQVLKIKESLYTDESESDNSTFIEITDKVLDFETICGFEKTGVSAYCERVETYWKSERFSFEVNKNFKQGEQIRLWFGDMYKEFTAVTDEDENPIPAGQFDSTKFSAEGSVKDMVAALCGCINASYEDGLGLYQAVYDENMIVIRCISYVGYNHTDIRVEMDESLISNGRVTIYEEGQEIDENFQNKGCVFKIKKDDKDIFLNSRYLKTIGENKLNSRILACVPYVNENDEVESDYFELTTDERGINVNVSNINMVEIIDRFYPKFGVLSFFPVMDFDFDTVFSSYGIYQAFYNECVRLEEKSMENDTGDSDSEYGRGKITTLAQGYLKDYGGKAIDTEYEYFMENFIPELCTQSKCTPYITKWGYYDDEKDSCENPYRLNMSKIFGTSNLSSNTFSNQYSINEHTHSMPYYLVKEITDETDNNMNYQYVKDTVGIFNWENNIDSEKAYNICVNYCVNIFSNTEVNNFDKLFSYKTNNDKRFNKKYSRMAFGDENHFATTLFRGVKFNIKKLNDDDVEIEGGDYNDYKFSFLYIPVELNSIFNSDNVYFVKNDTFKFIVGFILVNVFNNNTIDSKYGIDDFGKAYIYGGCYGLLNLPDISDDSDAADSDDEYYEVSLKNIPMNCLFDKVDFNDNWIEEEELVVINQSILRMIDNLENENCIKNIEIRKVGRNTGITYNVRRVSDNKLIFDTSVSLYSESNDMSEFIVNITFRDERDEDGNSKLYKEFYSVYESLSTCSIKERLDNEEMVVYHSTNGEKYRMEIEDPVSFNTYDIFMGNPYIVEESNENIPASSKITLKNNANDIVLKTINRYSGYYNPIFNPILMFNDYFINDGSGMDSDSDSEYSDEKEKYEYIRVRKDEVLEYSQKVDSVPQSPSGYDSPYIHIDTLYKLIDSSSDSYYYVQIGKEDMEGHTGVEMYNLPDDVNIDSPEYVTIIKDFYRRVKTSITSYYYETVDESEVTEDPVLVESKPIEATASSDKYVYTRELYRLVESSDGTEYVYTEIDKGDLPSDCAVEVYDVPSSPDSNSPSYISVKDDFYERFELNTSYEYVPINEEDIEGDAITLVDEKPSSPTEDSDKYIYTRELYRLVESSDGTEYVYTEIDKGDLPSDCAVEVYDVPSSPDSNSPSYISVKDDFYERFELNTSYEYVPINEEDIEGDVILVDEKPLSPTEDSDKYIYTRELYRLDSDVTPIISYSYELSEENGQESDYRENLPDVVDSDSPNYISLVEYYRREAIYDFNVVGKDNLNDKIAEYYGIDTASFYDDYSFFKVILNKDDETIDFYRSDSDVQPTYSYSIINLNINSDSNSDSDNPIYLFFTKSLIVIDGGVTLDGIEGHFELVEASYYYERIPESELGGNTPERVYERPECSDSDSDIYYYSDSDSDMEEYIYYVTAFYERQTHVEYSYSYYYTLIQENELNGNTPDRVNEVPEHPDGNSSPYIYRTTAFYELQENVEYGYRPISRNQIPEGAYLVFIPTVPQNPTINDPLYIYTNVIYYRLDSISIPSYYYERIPESELGGNTPERVYERPECSDSDSDIYYYSDSDSDMEEYIYYVTAFYELQENVEYGYRPISRNQIPEGAYLVFIPTVPQNPTINDPLYIYTNVIYYRLDSISIPSYYYERIPESELGGNTPERVYERPECSDSDSDIYYYSDSDSDMEEYIYYVTAFYELQEESYDEYSYEPITLDEMLESGENPVFRGGIENVDENDPEYIYCDLEYWHRDSYRNMSFLYIRVGESDFDYDIAKETTTPIPQPNQNSDLYVYIREYYKLVKVIDNNEYLPAHKYSNTSFDIDYKDFYSEFALIKNLWFHKVNEYYPDKIIKLMNPLYPAIGEFALDYRNYNIFESNWDNNYFTTQVDKKVTEMCAGTSGSLNKISMFGSKYLNVPDEITIDTFNRCVDWDDDFITRSKIILSDIMFKEVNGTSVSFYLFLYDRIVRYFARESGLRDVFEEYVNPEYSFGDKTTIEDDIKSYIEKNIMKLYYLDKIEMWVKEKKVGIHDSRIENNYKKFILIDNRVKVTKDMKKVNTFSIKKMTENQFDRCITYNLKKGCKEDFGFSFTIRKI